MGGETAEPLLHAAAALGTPYVVVDYNVIMESADCVIIDNYLIGSIAAEYLVKRGYTRIGFVGSPEQSSNIADRLNGFMKVMQQRNLPLRQDWLINNYESLTDTYGLDIPLPGEMPQAFICHCDRAAYYFIEKLKIAGFRVPSDVGIISLDTADLGARCAPSLTGLSIDKRRFASDALQLLTDRLGGRTAAQRIYLDTKIVERDSTPRLSEGN
ncbi:hypothetical protein FACS1894141_7460 [Spirochaetia bacterium]|nr:hypothetical protein FACS1894141_7460 [Spirochaetia bacterium]